MLERTDIEILINIDFWNLYLWTFLERESRGLRETSMGRFWLQNRFVSLPSYFKLIALDSYPHSASNHSVVQKKNFQSHFLVLYSKESVRNRQWTSPFFSWSLVCVRLLFSFPPFCQGFEKRRTFRLRKNKSSQGRTTHLAL